MNADLFDHKRSLLQETFNCLRRVEDNPVGRSGMASLVKIILKWWFIEVKIETIGSMISLYKI